MPAKKAVVIDDEKDLTTYLTTILEENDFSVKAANDAVSGEQLIREEQPDLILIDLVMPGRTGIQLFTKLRKDPDTKNIPLVMVTGIKEQMQVDWGEIVDRYSARKPDGFVEKPIEPVRLMSVVNAVMSGEAPPGDVVHG